MHPPVYVAYLLTCRSGPWAHMSRPKTCARGQSTFSGPLLLLVLVLPIPMHNCYNASSTRAHRRPARVVRQRGPAHVAVMTVITMTAASGHPTSAPHGRLHAAW